MLDPIQTQRSRLDALIACTAVGPSAELEMLAAEGQPDAEGLVPGKAFRIFKYGKVPTEKGVFNVPPEVGKQIASAWEDRGNDMHIDWEHGLVKTPPGQRIRTAGWCRVESKPDGLYAVNVRWTKEAYDALLSREYKYQSPLFNHTEDGTVVGLENVAITVDPATWNVGTISASSVPAALSATTKPKEKPMKNKLAKYLKSKMEEHELSADELAKECRMTTERLNKLASGEETPDQEEMSRLAKCLRVKGEHMSKLAMSEEPSESEVEKTYDIADKTAEKLAAKNAEKDALAAKDVPVKGADEKPAGFPAKLTALAAAITDPAAKGELMGVMAMFEGVSSLTKTVEALSARLESQEKTRTEDEKSRLLEDGEASGQIPPAMVSWAREQPIETLRSFLSVAPKVGPGRQVARQKSTATASGAGARTATLSRAAREVAELRGKTPQQVLKAHEERLERDEKKRQEEFDA
jgi:phage I-like protein